MNDTALTVTDWAASTPPLFPHSALIEGSSELGVVDVQQSKAETHRLIADLLERGKPLAWVYVTHPHLDHFAGAGLVRAAFPDAAFYGPVATMNDDMAFQVRTRRLPLGQGTPGGAGNLPETAPDFFAQVPAEGLTLDGQRVEILLGKGDHPHSSVVWVPSAQTLIGGDVIFNRIHAFFGDHNDIDSWIDLVERAQALHPRTVIAGHSGTLNPGGEIVALQLDWLKSLREAIHENDTWQHVKDVLTAKYPDFGNDFIFEFSYSVKNAN